VDLYTLTDQFLAKDPVDEFVSAIWTERYSSAGDVQLVLPATLENIDKLTPGTFLALRGTKEVMLLHTQSIENRLMTILGSTLVDFLNERVIWFKNPDYNTSEENSPKIVDYSDDTKKPGEFIADVVNKMVIAPVPMTGTAFDTEANLDWAFEAIPSLVLGSVDTSGTVKRLTVPTGPLYSGIAQLAEKEGVGISLYLDSANIDTGYVLKFTTYQGKDHTTGSAFPLVRLLPDMDTLSEVKEIRSKADYKNVVYVWYQGVVSLHYAEPTLPKPEGFERRVMVTDAEGEPVGRKYQRYGGAGYYYPATIVGAEEIAAFREQNAKDALANHNYIQAIDGQTSPNSDYKYGTDYGLGDIIELAGITGLISKARVTEYIRSQDKSGEREYPTISVI
jgi:hypothetical protein